MLRRVSSSAARNCRSWLSSFQCRHLTTPPSTTLKAPTIEVLGKSYPTDDYSNITPAILSRLSAQLINKPAHPLCTLKSLIQAHFADYAHLSTLSPIVTAKQNFDDLSFPADHPGRAVTDSYYINRDVMLRTHTSAHEVEVFAAGHKKWLLTADVYRRDEIDASHYPVFHQMEGARLFPHDYASVGPALAEENKKLSSELQDEHVLLMDDTKVDELNPYQEGHHAQLADLVTQNLKYTLSLLLFKLFANLSGATKADPLQIRWITAYFPFTTPSYEVEVLFRGKWLEILGCGVVQQATLTKANVPNEIGWAFGLGLERIAMILFQIPDVRFFWSEDPRFLSQFTQDKISTFKPYSKYPSCYKDVSFWRPEGFHFNDFCDQVRTVAGDMVENVDLIDEFIHPKSKRTSLCYRINYRSMDRSLSNEEVNDIHAEVITRVKSELGVEIR